MGYSNPTYTEHLAEAVVHILDRQVGVTEKPDGRRLSGTNPRRSVIEQWRRS
jgi:dTDP-4-dehydrorhamnose reductase